MLSFAYEATGFPFAGTQISARRWQREPAAKRLARQCASRPSADRRCLSRARWPSLRAYRLHQYRSREGKVATSFADRSDGSPGNLRCLLVGQTVDTHERDERAQIPGKFGHGGTDRREVLAAFDDVSPIASRNPLGRFQAEAHTAHLAGAHPVEPIVLGNTIHPAVQACSRLPLRDPRQRTHARFLNEIVGLVEVAGHYERKSPQTRHELNHPSAELVRHAFAPAGS
jgi:hypothetical protein